MIFDIIGASIILISVIYAMKRGFFASLISVIMNVLLVGGVIFFGDDFNLYLKEHTTLYETVNSKITQSLANYISGQGDSSWIGGLIKNFGYGSTPVEELSQVLSDKIMFIVSVVILILLGLLAAGIVNWIVKAITEDTALEGMDKLLAFLFGLVSGAVVVAMVATIAIFVSQMTPGAAWLNSLLEGSYVVGIVKLLPFFQ